MKNTIKRTISLVLAAAMVLSCFGGLSTRAQAAATDAVTVSVSGSSIVIGNGYIGREFSTAGNKLSTTEIVNRRTEGDTVFTPAEGSEEFVIRVTKDSSSGSTSIPALDRTGWTATANSRHNASGDSDGPASNLLDGRLESIWHTNYGGGVGPQSYPYNVVFTLNGSKTFSCFSYTPRQQGEDTNGNIKGYELYYATAEEQLDADAAGWIKVAEGNFKYEGVNPIYVNLDEAVTATQVKLVATSSKNGQQFAGGAEFNLHPEKAPVATNDREFAASALELDGDPIVADTTAVINDVEKTGKMVTFNFKPYEFKGVTYTVSEVIVMYNGDHFMRKYMEIETDNDQAAIDFIDLESLRVNDGDQQWTIPTDAGNAGELGDYKAMLGQPIYIQGMFFGCEFPVADTQIEEGVGRIRYYTGKTFERLGLDNQLTTDGKYVTWQTVAGAARSTEMQVIQADFFEYIYSIATPSDFRIQYNSWFDNMMLIDDENILESFIEIDQELNKAEVRPLDSYVVDDGWNNYNYTYVRDASRSGTTLNQSGFWEFNTKFPNELYPSSTLVQKFGSNFGVWIGPRGGYNFQGDLASILTNSGKGSGAGGSVDVADREYVKNFQEMACDWQDRFNVNYWKWDGFANAGQYSAFAAADGVPGYANRHMTGGYQNMYHVTDLWEAWIDLFEAVRANAESNGIENLWISLTCYVNPSPWYLQWANSVWLQCLADQRDASFGTTKMNKQITYRDATYYAYTQLHQFQFPLANIYNHDPVYGTEGTGMNKNTATDEEFQNYLYMLSTRGTMFWELYFSDSIMTDEKYEVTAEFLEWAEENAHILKNAKMIGGMPDTTNLTDFNSNESAAEAYGFSCFDGTDGIISIRNPHSYQSKTITVTFDRTIGVAEDCGTLDYYLEHTYNLTEGTEATGTFEYGKTYTFTLAPNEVRIFAVSKGGDTTAPVMERAFTDGDRVITVRFNEKVVGTEFAVSGAQIESVAQSADDVTYRITLTEAPADKTELTVTASGIADISGNACANTVGLIYNAGNVVATGAADAASSLQTGYGFTVSSETASTEAAVLVAQGAAYELGIDANGYAYFTVNGATAVSDAAVAIAEDAETASVIGVRENNGMLKLYVNGTLAGSAYKAENRYFAVPAAAITVNAAKAAVYDIAYGYDELDAAEGPASTKIEGVTGEGSSVDTSEPAFDKSVGNAFDGDYNTFWATVEEGTLEEDYLIADLNGEYTINKVAYTKRNHETAGYNCTGNLLDYIIEVSTDGEVWTQVAAGDTVDGTTVIEFEPVQAAFVRLRATRSYHWQEANANKVMTVAEFEIFEFVVPPMEPDDDSRDIPLSALEVSCGDYEPDGGASEGPAELAVDNNDQTIWHTDWQGTSRENHWFQFELTDTYKVDGLRILPRQTGNTNGIITEYKIQVSNDGVTFTDVASGTWEADRLWKLVQFSGQTVKYVRLVALDGVTDNSWVFASAAEIRLTGVKVSGGEQPHAHEWSDWTVTTAPTCTEAGVEERSCACGETETRETEALGHDFVDGTCTNCGEQEEAPVAYGKLTGITGVGSSVDDTEPAFDKSVGNAFDGDYSTFWATVPGGTLTDAYLIADLGGAFTIDKVEYTKRFDSAAQYNCTGNLLDYIIEVSTDGETWTQVAAGATVDGTTEITFEPVQAAYVRLRATQSYHWQESGANTVMTVAELAVYGIAAGDTHEHTAAEAVIENEKAATCTEAGSYDSVVYCAECGEELSRESVTVPALGHSEETVPGTAATCTETGLTEGKRCTVCGETTVAQEVIPALGHNEITVPGMPATCTATGLTDGKRCTTCGQITVPQEDIPATGHTEEVVPAVAATCTETGLTEGKKCAVCGETLVAQEVIPALGHSWKGVECERCDATRENPFVDVPNDSFCIDPVLWAVEEGITTGTSATTFDPNGKCARAIVVTFLWRAAGSPEPETANNPFTDVKESDFYYKAVLWAVENGITTGTSATTFSPAELCNRATVVTFLYRAQGSPEVSTTENPFSDVKVDSWYGPAVLWAVENGITNGMGDGTFGVGATCTRAQVVTFLYRTLVK